VLTLVASALVSDEAQPLSTVESGHDPFDLCRNQSLGFPGGFVVTCLSKRSIIKNQRRKKIKF
jgi:hypothetical protein